MKLAVFAMLPLLLSVSADVFTHTPAPQPPKNPPAPAEPAAKTPPQTPTNKPAAKPATPRPQPATPAQAASTVATVTVTDRGGAPIAEVDVSLTGLLDRFGSTQPNGVVKFDGLRPGIYRLRFEKEGYNVLEREFEVRAGQPAPNPTVTLSPAPPPPAPPPAPEPPKAAPAPPPGKPTAVAMPDFIEKNFITNTQPQKVTTVACSGATSTMLWQVREPWVDRQHATAEAMLYVVGGEGTIRIDGRDTQLRAGSFASVPRGTSYSLTRSGRNPLVVLATLAGEPCTQ
jgi:mannose-6-phosphate isomerase-like protein (cupin superfamily)